MKNVIMLLLIATTLVMSAGIKTRTVIHPDLHDGEIFLPPTTTPIQIASN